METIHQYNLYKFESENSDFVYASAYLPVILSSYDKNGNKHLKELIALIDTGANRSLMHGKILIIMY